jgi:hypothetical protein
MKLSRSAWMDFFIAAGLVVLAAGLAYLPYASGLGFYHDDWFTVASRVGGVYLTDMHAGDRPMMGWLYEALTRLLGERPLYWHLFIAGGRMFAALALWAILKLLWPRLNFLATSAAVLFALYPGFLQMPSANNYTNHIVAYSAGLVSLALSLAAVRAAQRWPWRRSIWAVVPLLALSAGLTRVYPAVYETFIGLEGVRILLLWYILRPALPAWPARPGKTAARLGRTLLFTAPNLTAAAWFLYWRFFVFESTRPATDTAVLVQSYTNAGASGLPALLRIPLTYLISMAQILFAAWFAPLINFLRLPQPGAFLLGAGLALLLGAVLFLFLPREPAGENTFPLAPAWIGLAGLALTTLPVILVGREVRFDSYMDRYTLQSSALAALTLAALIGLLPRPSWRAAAVMGFAALALLTHTLNAANYREVWRLQRSLWWQLSWRAPQLKPDTVLIPFMPDGYRFVEDFEIWAPANRIYQPEPKIIYLSGAIVTQDALDLMTGQQTVGRTWRLIRYEKRFDQALVLSIPAPDACLHVLNGAYPEFSRADGAETRLIGAISKPERIRTGVEAAVPPQALFGPEPAHTWCYYYQKISLARQENDWAGAAALADQANNAQVSPNDPVEWTPVFEAYAAVKRWQDAAVVADLVKKQPELAAALCPRYQAAQPYALMPDETVRTHAAQLICSAP